MKPGRFLLDLGCLLAPTQAALFLRSMWRQVESEGGALLARPLQSLMIEAINDLLGKHARPKVAARPDAST